MLYSYVFSYPQFTACRGQLAMKIAQLFGKASNSLLQGKTVAHQLAMGSPATAPPLVSAT